LIKKLKEDIVAQEKEKADISQKLTDLRIKYRPQLQKYQMLEDSLYNQKDDQLLKDKAIKYELSTIMVFLEQMSITIPDIQALQSASNSLNQKLSDNNSLALSLFKKLVNEQVNNKYPSGDFYFNIMTVLMVYCKNHALSPSISQRFESKLPANQTPPVQKSAEIINNANAINVQYNETTDKPVDTKNNIMRFFNWFKHDVPPNNPPQGGPNGPPLLQNATQSGPNDQPQNQDQEKKKKKKKKKIQALEQQPGQEQPATTGGSWFSKTMSKKTSHINLPENFEKIIEDNIEDINNSQYYFVYKILLNFKEQFLQKTVNINNPYYFNFVFTSMINKYLYQDYYKTIDNNIYNYINTDVYSKDLKNDIFFIYGQNNKVFLFNNYNKEYKTIINYLNGKYKDNWNSRLTTNNPDLLKQNLKAPLIDNELSIPGKNSGENEEEKEENGKEKEENGEEKGENGEENGEEKEREEAIIEGPAQKGGSSVLLQTDIIYNVCTPLFLAYQYQKLNTNKEFVKAMKTVFYDSYIFAIENDPNRVLKVLRSQTLYNSLKSSFNRTFPGKSNKLKSYKDLLKERKRGVCQDIEEKFNLLKEKCKPHNYGEDVDNLLDNLMSSFDTKPVPLEHKVKLDVFPSVIDENKMNIMITDDIKGDSIFDKMVDVDNSMAMNPFLEPSINLLQPVKENVIDISLPDPSEENEEEEEIKKIEAQKKKTIRVSSSSFF